jgi:putative endonuclease
MERCGFVYMLANRKQGTLYIGVTSDLMRRMSEHRQGLIPGFTDEHGVKRLVWIEQFGEIESAISREKLLKKWHRAWKIRLIEAENPDWDDLAVALLGFEPLPANALQKRDSGDGPRPSPG